MADQWHSKSNHWIELCMREKDGRTAWATRGGTGFARSAHTHWCRRTHISFPVPFTSQLSVAIIITISFVVSSEVCKSCSWPFLCTHHLPHKAPNYNWHQQLHTTREFLYRYGPKLFHSFILSCIQSCQWFHVLLERYILKLSVPHLSRIPTYIRNQIKFRRTVGKVLSPRKQRTMRTTYSTAEIGKMNYNVTKMTQFTKCF